MANEYPKGKPKYSLRGVDFPVYRTCVNYSNCAANLANKERTIFPKAGSRRKRKFLPLMDGYDRISREGRMYYKRRGYLG